MKTPQLIGVIGLLAVAALGGGYLYLKSKTTTVTVKGQILVMNLADRSGMFEFEHPKTGEKFETRASVAPDCTVTINGKPGKLEDLRTNEWLTATGEMNRLGQVIATKFEVNREDSANAPEAEPTEATTGTQDDSATTTATDDDAPTPATGDDGR